jgi:hypothetical protein
MFWNLLAKFLALPTVAQWLINRALQTPYAHITSADGEDVYMGRWWLFNPYLETPGLRCFKWFPWSIRVHHICREDQDRDLHDHPWNARTFILVGGYVEERESLHGRPRFGRSAGDTASLKFGEYHRITQVTPDGAWTLFITGPYQGTWGFLVNGVKVNWRTYLGLDK